jgi:hypothetical protein
LYVDDVFLIGDDDHKLLMVEEELEKHYKMSWIDLTKLYIGVELLYFIEGIMLIQYRYVGLF